MTLIGQWQPLPGQSITKVSPGDYVCTSCLIVSSRAPCIVCSRSDILEDDHFLVSGFSASHGRSGPTDTMLAAPPAAPPPLSTPPQSAAPEQPRRCSISPSASEPPSSRLSPAYHSAAEDFPEAERAPEPPDEFTSLDQTQAEGVGIVEGRPPGCPGSMLWLSPHTLAFSMALGGSCLL